MRVLYLLLFLFTSNCCAESYILDVCQNGISQYDLGCNDGQDIECLCTNDVFISSLLDCIHRFTNNTEMLKSIVDSYIHYGCSKAFTFDIWESIYQTAVDSNSFILSTNIIDSNSTLKSPIILSQDELDLNFKTVKTYYWQFFTGTLFGGIILAYWGLVLSIGSIINLLNYIYPKIFQQNHKFNRWFKKNISTPATFGQSHSAPCIKFQVFGVCIPTRIQSIVLLGYFILNIILILVKYDLFLPNSYYETTEQQFLRYIAARCGIIAFIHLPVIIIFAGRNNLFIWCTGWSFDTFNVYHRWTARVMVLHALIHALAYTSLVIFTGVDYTTEYGHKYWVYGVIALVMGCFILAKSILYVRSRFYELFRILHISLGCVFLAACYYHCKTLGWIQWIYTSFAIWAFDRFIRLFHVLFSGYSTATISLYPDNIMKMTISYSNLWKCKPGSYVFIHILTKTNFWQSHPFSIYESPESPGKIVICAAVRNGLTKNISSKLQESASKSLKFSIALDGPYGHNRPLQHYHSILFIAGGVGITALYSYIYDLGSRANQRLKLIWIIRNDSVFQWFGEELKYLLSYNIEIEMHITTSKCTEKTTISEMISVNYGVRPEINSLVTDYAETASGNCAIMVCGPPKLNDSVRNSVASNFEISKGNLDFFEESYSW